MSRSISDRWASRISPDRRAVSGDSRARTEYRISGGSPGRDERVGKGRMVVVSLADLLSRGWQGPRRLPAETLRMLRRVLCLSPAWSPFDLISSVSHTGPRRRRALVSEESGVVASVSFGGVAGWGSYQGRRMPIRVLVTPSEAVNRGRSGCSARTRADHEPKLLTALSRVRVGSGVWAR